MFAASPGASGLLLLPCGCLWGQPRGSSIWGVSVIPLAEKWCFRVKPPGRQEALKALELGKGKVRPRVHQRSSALPIQGQDCQQWPRRVVKKQSKRRPFLTKGVILEDPTARLSTSGAG